jgi:hypothetical protein
MSKKLLPSCNKILTPEIRILIALCEVYDLFIEEDLHSYRETIVALKNKLSNLKK